MVCEFCFFDNLKKRKANYQKKNKKNFGVWESLRKQNTMRLLLLNMKLFHTSQLQIWQQSLKNLVFFSQKTYKFADSFCKKSKSKSYSDGKIAKNCQQTQFELSFAWKTIFQDQWFWKTRQLVRPNNKWLEFVWSKTKRLHQNLKTKSTGRYWRQFAILAFGCCNYSRFFFLFLCFFCQKNSKFSKKKFS